MRRLLVASAILTLFVTTVSPALAWPSKMEGRPLMADYAEGQPDPPTAGVYLWVDDRNRVQVRVMGDQRYRLTFSLHYGEIGNIQTYGLDLNDHLKQDQTKGILFADIAGSNVPEGARFTIGGNRLTIDCTTDGSECPRDKIFLGQAGANPTHLPFTVSRKD